MAVHPNNVIIATGQAAGHGINDLRVCDVTGSVFAIG